MDKNNYSVMPFIKNNDRGSISRKYEEDIHHIFSRGEGGSNHEDNKKNYIFQSIKHDIDGLATN